MAVFSNAPLKPYTLEFFELLILLVETYVHMYLIKITLVPIFINIAFLKANKLSNRFSVV
jgi:hypothetical protein